MFLVDRLMADDRIGKHLAILRLLEVLARLAFELLAAARVLDLAAVVLRHRHQVRRDRRWCLPGRKRLQCAGQFLVLLAVLGPVRKLVPDEILDSVGLLSPFLESAEHVQCTRLYSADLSELRTATFKGADCRCQFLCSPPQYETERILETHLVSLGGAIERGVTVTKLDLDSNGVLAELMHAEGGIETVHAREVPVENVDPVAEALQRNARAMLDVDYAGSPLVNDYAENRSDLAEPHPGQRYPDWAQFGGTSYHLLVFGAATDAEALAGFGRRWTKCVKISYNPDVRRERAGLLTDGIVLIRPDGHIGFRFPAADAAALAALDRHLSSYLIPDSPVALL